MIVFLFKWIQLVFLFRAEGTMLVKTQVKFIKVTSAAWCRCWSLPCKLQTVPIAKSANWPSLFLRVVCHYLLVYPQLNNTLRKWFPNWSPLNAVRLIVSFKRFPGLVWLQWVAVILFLLMNRKQVWIHRLLPPVTGTQPSAACLQPCPMTRQIIFQSQSFFRLL